MRKKASSRNAASGRILGRRQFAKISAVEGIFLSGATKRTFAQFDHAGLSAEERRRAIIDRFKHRAG
jgi:hypothetical protein